MVIRLIIKLEINHTQRCVIIWILVHLNVLPIKKLQKLILHLDTYDENYIVMNNDKIIQRIKGLFKEHYFFKKLELIKHINVVKSYPLLQIYAALDQIIGDKNEFIVDRYGTSWLSC